MVGRPLTHAALSLALWVPALILLGVFLLAVLRGLFYGLVDDGPYDNSWGGPTRGGAWAMHALVALPLFAAVALGVRGLAALHIRVTRRLVGGSGSGWAIPVALLIAAAGVLLVVAWSRQI